MADPTEFAGKRFAELEHAGWERAAGTYGGGVGAITSATAVPLLEAVGVRADMRVLDLCCGPGYVAAAATAHGAEAVGLDFSAEMVACAGREVPGARFDQGDAQALPYGDGRFDAVLCAFGLLHLPEPDRALAEAFRVLAPGGRFAYTVWCVPDRMPYFELILGAVRTHGTMDVALPEAPPMFRFADAEEAGDALRAAGFVDPTFRELDLSLRTDTPEEVLDFVYGSTVRMPMVLRLQTDDARERIHAAIIEGARRFETDGSIEIAMPAVLGSARKPA